MKRPNITQDMSLFRKIFGTSKWIIVSPQTGWPWTDKLFDSKSEAFNYAANTAAGKAMAIQFVLVYRRVRVRP